MVPDSPATTLIVELARAYNLLDIYPLRHPTVQDVLREIDRAVEALDAPIEIGVEGEGLVVHGDPVGDRHGHIRKLARRLGEAGVEGLRVTPDVASADFEPILDVLHAPEAVRGVGRFSGLVAGSGGTRAEIVDRPTGPEAPEEGEPDADDDAAPGSGPAPGGEESEAEAGLVTSRDDSMYEAMKRRDYDDVDLAELAAELLSADDHERDDLVRRFSTAASESRQEVDDEALAGALEVLAGGIDDAMPRESQAEIYDLITDIATPGAVGRLVGELGAAARDAGRREALVHALTRVGSDAARRVAEALAEAKDRAARRAYLETLVEFCRVHGISTVEGMLDDDRWFVVRNGVSIVGEVGGPEAMGYLTPTLAHDDPRVRKEAVAALSKIGGADAEALIMGALNDADPSVRSAAILALGVHKVGRAVEPLVDRLEVEEDDDVAVEILRALGRIGDAAAVPAVEKRTAGGLFSRPAKPVRIAALRALGSIGTPHARSILERAADERDPDVSAAAKAAL